MDDILPTNEPNAVVAAPPKRGKSLGQNAWERLRKNKLALAGAALIVLLAIVCFCSPLISRLVGFTYDQQNLGLGPVQPGGEHWLGTDRLGRDLFIRLLYGGRISLMVGLCATFVSLTIGVFYGAVSGFIGGKLDSLMMRIVDILYALPFTIFVILLLVFFGNVGNTVETFLLRRFHWKISIGSNWNMLLLFAAIGAVEWLTMARIVRGQVMALKQQEFIDAARILGVRKRRIILRHMIPNLLGPVIVYATLTIPGVMLLEAFLSFLGLGVQPPMSSWGLLIKEGAEVMEEYPWLLLFPGTVLALTLFSLNFLGDGLRDALDVRGSKD